MSKRTLTERGVIAELSRIFDSPSPPEGIGDDCSVLRVGREKILLSTDMLLQGTHFPEYMGSREKGYMAAAVNLSDIAAMGGKPIAMLVSLGLPASMNLADIKDIARGIRNCAEMFGVKILGGDTKKASELTLSITVVGSETGKALLRSAARPGQLIAVTGTLGGAAADYLDWIKKGKFRRGSKLTNPVPRINEAVALSRGNVAKAAIDVTDGLALSAWYLSRASRVRIELEMQKLPVAHSLSSAGLDATSMKEALLYWGGEYELLFTCRSGKDLEKAAARMRTPVKVIGRVLKGSGVYLKEGRKMIRLEERGYDSFAGGKGSRRL